MLNENMLDLARAAGLRVDAEGDIGPAFHGSVAAGYSRFAQLVAEHERRACMDRCAEDAIHYVALGRPEAAEAVLRSLQHIGELP